MKNIVGVVDIGTSRSKVSVYRVHSNKLELVHREEYSSGLRVEADRAEQDPEVVYKIIRHGARVAREKNAAIIGVSVYRGSIIAWRRDGSPLSPIITWLDKRSLFYYDRAPVLLKLASRLPVIGKVFMPGSPLLLLLSLTRQDPVVGEAVKRGEGFLWSLDGFISYRVSGRYLADPASSALSGLIHPGSLSRIGLVARIAGLDWLPLPEFFYHTEVVGEIEGIDVGPIIADQQAGVIGLGCLEEGCLKATLGTGFFLDYCTGSRLVLSPGGGLIPLLVLYTESRRIYGVEGFLAGVGLYIEYLAEKLGWGYEVFDRARWYRAGALVLPMPSGLRSPFSPYLEPTWLGSVLPLGPEEASSAVVLGISLGIASIYERLVERLGAPNSIRVSGGLARLRGVVDGVSSATSSEVLVAREKSDSSLGVAILAAIASGIVEEKFLYEHSTEYTRVRYERIIPRGVVALWEKLVTALGRRSFWRRYRRLLEEILFESQKR